MEVWTEKYMARSIFELLDQIETKYLHSLLKGTLRKYIDMKLIEQHKELCEREVKDWMKKNYKGDMRMEP